MPNRSPVKKRLSIHNWNPGPPHRREGAIEKHIAGKWHAITLQEAIEYVDHEPLTNRFHVTHYGGCAVLLIKDTFSLDVKAKSIYLHDIRRVLPDKVVETQEVLSRASFRRQPPNGKKTFTVMSLHINNNYAKKRGIGKKVILTIRAVMLDEKVPVTSTGLRGDATTAAISVSFKTPLLTAPCRCLPAPHRCGVPERFQVSGRTFVDSSTPRIQMENGKYASMAHCPFPTKLLASVRPIRAAITRYDSPWILFNGAAHNHITKDTIDGFS